MEPRWEPGYPVKNYPHDTFVGYIEEFDLYIDFDEHSEFPITLVAEVNGERGHNFDGFRLNGNEIEPATQPDLHITPYHMCLIYAAAIEHGLIKEQDNGTTMGA